MKVLAVRHEVVEETPQEIHAEHVELLPNDDLAVMTMTCVGADRQSESWICSTMNSAYHSLRERHRLTVAGQRHTTIRMRTGAHWRTEEYTA